MGDAFRAVTGKPPSMRSKRDVRLFTAAWTLAKQKAFYSADGKAAR
jgi:hypothetical protein